jgi:predicted MFS family arabinose efflux permease
VRDENDMQPAAANKEEQIAKDKDVKRRNLFIFVSLSLLYFFSIVHRVGVAVIAKRMMLEFSADNTLIGLMSSAYFFPYALAQIPVGLLLDRIGVRKTIGALGLIAAVGNALFALAPNIALVTVGRALVGFGVGGFYVSSLKAIAIWFDKARFATLTGILTAVGNFGAFFAATPLDLVSVALGWRGAYLVIFVIMSVAIALSWVVLRRDEPVHTEKKHSVFGDLKTIFTYRQFLLVMMIPFLSYGIYISFQGLWAGPFLSDVYGFDSTVASFYLTFISIGFIISSPLGGYLSDNVLKARRPVLLVGLLLSLVVWIIFGQFGQTLGSLGLISTFFTLGFATGFIYVFMSMSKELFPASISGTGIASFNQFNFIGGGFYEFFMGWVLDVAFGGVVGFAAYQVVFLISAVSLVLSVILTVAAKETFGKTPDEQDG